MDLQPPPLWQHYLLESPWLLVMGIVGVGVVVRLVGKQRGRPRLAQALWVALVLAATIVALARLVTTNRERVIELTRSLIAATVPMDAAAVVSYLADDAVLVGPHGETWMTLDQIRGELDTSLTRYPIATQSIRDLQAEVRRDMQGYSSIDLRTTLSEGLGAQAPIPSKWLLTWRKDTTGGWRIYRVQWLELMHQPATPGTWQ